MGLPEHTGNLGQQAALQAPVLWVRTLALWVRTMSPICSERPEPCLAWTGPPALTVPSFCMYVIFAESHRS